MREGQTGRLRYASWDEIRTSDTAACLCASSPISPWNTWSSLSFEGAALTRACGRKREAEKPAHQSQSPPLFFISTMVGSV